jgi:hypothetical protein
MLWAELRGCEGEWRRLGAQLSLEHGFLEVMPFAFVMLARRRFGQVRDLREVTRFVAAFNELAPPRHRLEARAAEAVIRSILGESHLADAVDRERTGLIMYALLFALVDDLCLDDLELRDVLRAAETAVSRIDRGALLAGEEARAWSDATVVASKEMRWRPGQSLTVRCDDGPLR